VPPSNDFCASATEIVLTQSSSLNTIYRDDVDMTLASSIFTEFYDDGAANTTPSSIWKALNYAMPLACTNIDLTSHGVWYHFSTKDLSGLSSTCYNLTAHTSSPKNAYLNLAVFKGDSCPTPLDPSTLEPSNRTKLYFRDNSIIDSKFPYSCVAHSSLYDAIGSSTINFRADVNETYFIYVGSSSSHFGNVSLSLTVRSKQ
jgi:hypothetical protein